MSFQANVNAENSPVTGEVVENGTQIIESGGWTQDAVVGTGGNQTIYAGGKVVPEILRLPAACHDRRCFHPGCRPRFSI